jgi:DNA-binding CsgD family transcriptional regulator/Tfp pilus assembly protein PilF
MVPGIELLLIGFGGRASIFDRNLVRSFDRHWKDDYLGSMKFTLAIFLFFGMIVTYGQSWNSLIGEASSDTAKIEVMKEAAESFRGRNYDSAFYYGFRGLFLSRQLGYEKGIGDLAGAIGTFHFFQSNYDSAIHYYTRSYEIAQVRHDSLKVGALLNNIGTVYSYQARYDTALTILFQAREIREEINDPKIASTYNNIGLAYQKQGELAKALKYHLRSATLKEQQGATRSLSNTYNNIGIILKSTGKYDSAIIYYEKALKIAQDYDDKNKEANAHNNLAILYENFPDWDQKAIFHYHEAIRIKKEIGDKVGLANSYFNYAELFNRRGRYEEALEMINLAEQVEFGEDNTLHTYNWLLMKANTLRGLKRYEEAMDIQRQALDTRYEELSQEKNDRIAELEVAYETTQKEAEIKRLSLENDLQEQEFQSTRIFLTASFSVSILILILILTIYYQRSRKQSAEREAQQLQIEALQKRLIDLNASPVAMHLELSDLNRQLHNELTEREYEVLSLSMEGKTNQEIAEKLFISGSTVKFHLRNVYAKLGVNNRKEAVEYVAKA